jgi:tRNA pseudouridine32 synthase/23S rRNA pseudouridine746 synthase
MQEIPGEPNSETCITRLGVQGGRALYQLEPVTGKRHQLRVHMMAMGMPIVGDQFYPTVRRGPQAQEDFSDPLQLLAQSVRFTDPLTGQARELKSQLKLQF